MGEQIRALERLNKKRSKIALTLMLILILAYFGFVILAGFFPEISSHQILPGFTVCIALGVFVFFVTWFVTLLYVLWSNKVYDQALVRIRAIRSSSH